MLVPRFSYEVNGWGIIIIIIITQEKFSVVYKDNTKEFNAGRSFYCTVEASFTALMKVINMTFRLIHFHFSVSCKNKYDVRSVVFPQTN